MVCWHNFHGVIYMKSATIKFCTLISLHLFNIGKEIVSEIKCDIAGILWTVRLPRCNCYNFHLPLDFIFMAVLIAIINVIKDQEDKAAHYVYVMYIFFHDSSNLYGV